MRAARLKPTSPEGMTYTFPTNTAPSSAIEIRDDIPKPVITKSDEILIQVKASSIWKDNLIWNELYPPKRGLLGNDFAGIVVEVHKDVTGFKPGDHVYGMSDVENGGMWAEYAIVRVRETTLKPDSLTWEEAAALPGAAHTADQALFVHAGLSNDAAGDAKRVLITGASGGVGIYLVQFALAAGHHVIAATSSTPRNESFLRSLGVREIIEYGEFSSTEKADFVIDSVGGQVLKDCWEVVKPNGTLVSFDGYSWNFIEEQQVKLGKESIRALYMISEPSPESMERVTKLVVNNGIKGCVRSTVPLSNVRKAYDSVHTRGGGFGRIVVMI